jgi:tetratricopeptide (TPR) repeat protein
MTINRKLWGFCALLLCGLGFPHRGAGQTPSGNTAKVDYSKEPYVIEKDSTTAEFHSDGTYTVAYLQRMRIQSQAALQQFGILKIPYPSANASVEIAHVRVIKPSGQVVETPAESVMEMPAEITRDAPFYSDIKEKHVAIRGLEVGDELEYECTEDVHTPMDPGQFWWSYRFFEAGIVLENDLQIGVPKDRYVKVHSSGPQPSVTEEGQLRIYRWKTANLTAKPPKMTSNFDDYADLPAPPVQVTTFKTWQEVGAWFAGLAESRAQPTPEIRAKAEELTRGDKNNTEKMEALYNYVSAKLRYVAIGLGIGRYQPHAAADVLANGYGDCKDKHTLLAALLASEGIPAYPVLIDSGTKVDPDIPSPGQFNHVITVVPDGKSYVWLDSTPGVAPFAFLTVGLRDTEALVMPTNGPAELVKTPAEPPFPSLFEYSMDGTLDSAGTLTATARIIARGDEEIPFRLAFRSIGQTQWKDATQQMSYTMGFAGDVSDVTTSDLDATGEVFQMQYKYIRKDYSDWQNNRIGAPLPPAMLPEIPADMDKDSKPISWRKTQVVSVANITLPPGTQLSLPSSVELKENFGSYSASYSFTGGVLHVERRLTKSVNEISLADTEVYRTFQKAIENDQNNMIAINAAGASVSALASTAGTPEARKLYESGRDAWMHHDMPTAMEDLQGAVDKDPNFAQGWLVLGSAHMSVGDTDRGISELQKGVALDPHVKTGYEMLGSALQRAHRADEALAMWKQVEKSNPSDAEAPEKVASILLYQKDYKDAIPELESAVSKHPTDANLQQDLGFAYLEANNDDKGVSALQKSVALDSSPASLNNIAYGLAAHGLRLSDAESYAQKAVAAQEQRTSTITANDLHFEDVSAINDLYLYWDTLGWVYFAEGRLDDAVRYLEAAWNLSQDPQVGDHLGQALEKQGKKKEAIEAYARAVAAGRAPEETRKRLVAASGSDARADAAVQKARTDLGQLRTIRLGRLVDKERSAEVFVVLGEQGKTADIHFIKGAEDLRNLGKAIPADKFNPVYPDAGPTKLLRRGVLVCEPTVSGCMLALMLPADVHSLN